MLVMLPSKPRHCTHHPDPGNQPRDVADLNGVWKRAKAGEDAHPIMLRLIGYGPDCYERQFQAQSVRHVGGHTGKAVKKSKGAEDCTGELTADDKAGRQQRWNDQLKQRSTPESESFSQPAEKKMSPFMDGKMNVIQQRQFAPMKSQICEQQGIEDHPRPKLRL